MNIENYEDLISQLLQITDQSKYGVCVCEDDLIVKKFEEMDINECYIVSSNDSDTRFCIQRKIEDDMSSVVDYFESFHETVKNLKKIYKDER